MPKSKLTLDDNINIRTDYMSGLSATELSEKYKVSQALIAKILNSDDRISRRLAEEKILQKLQKETDAIVQIKDNILEFFRSAIKSAQDEQKPHLYLKDVAGVIEKLDKIQRLNQSRPTNINEERSFTSRFDVNEAMNQLKTPEDKLNFLRKQVSPQNYDQDTSNQRRTAKDVIEQEVE